MLLWVRRRFVGGPVLVGFNRTPNAHEIVVWSSPVLRQTHAGRFSPQCGQIDPGE